MHRYALLFAFLLHTPVSAADAPAKAAEFDPKVIDEAAEKALKEFQAPGCAVVIVKDGQVIYLKGFGVREKGKPEKVTPDTVFPIASCTKAFTATALAMLVDEGKLKWDDKVHDHLDYFRLSDELADREVTLRDLLSHRTGMPRHDMLWSGQDAYTPDIIRQWGKGKPSTSFRSTWEYSNVPFTTAGVIAGKIEKSDWASVMKNRIFKPLGMEKSSATWKEGHSQADHATPHYYGFDKPGGGAGEPAGGGPDNRVSAIKWDEIDHAGGAGCVNSTARDMAAWLQFQLAGGKYDGRRLLTEKALRETHTPQMLVKPEGPFLVYFPPRATRFTSYGLGWFVHDYRGATCLSHGGTLTGFRAQCMLVPERNIGVFAMCNLRPSYVTEAVCKTALDSLLGLPAEDWVKFHKNQLTVLDFQTAVQKKKRESTRKPDTKPSLALGGYAGRYSEPAYGLLEVAAEGDKLILRWGKLTFRAEHYHFDTFTAIPLEPKDEIVSFDRSTFDVQFRLGTNGDVESVKFLEQEFKRAKK